MIQNVNDEAYFVHFPPKTEQIFADIVSSTNKNKSGED